MAHLYLNNIAYKDISITYNGHKKICHESIICYEHKMYIKIKKVLYHRQLMSKYASHDHHIYNITSITVIH